jgi:hypothetical protein
MSAGSIGWEKVRPKMEIGFRKGGRDVFSRPIHGRTSAL